MKQYEEKIYYVYVHRHPCRDEFAYVGHGKGPRAWMYGTYAGKHAGAYGHRKQQHTDWCENLIAEGYIPSDWTFIEMKCLTKKKACELEQKFIREYQPMFNSPAGKKLLKLTAEDVGRARGMKSRGMSYGRIGVELGVATMTVHRALTGGNKNEPE